MKRLLFLIIAVLQLILITGCAVYDAPVVPYSRMSAITYLRAPLTTDFNNTPVGLKKGTASGVIYFREPFLTNLSFAAGDATIEEAAKNGGLKKVYYADYEYLNILGIYAKFTVNAYGE